MPPDPPHPSLPPERPESPESPEGSESPGSPGSPARRPGPVLASSLRTTREDGRRLDDASLEALRGLNRAAVRSGRLSPLAYNVTVSHEHRFVWYRNAKVATRTLVAYFATHEVPLALAHPSQVRLPTAAFAGYLKFGFVRDPVERFVSAWRDKVVGQNHFGFDEPTLARMQDIDEFAAWVGEKDLHAGATDRHLVHQTRALDLSQIDFLGRLETFDDDFAEICRRVGTPVVQARAHNTSGAQGRPSLDAGTVATIRRLYALDHQVLGY